MQVWNVLHAARWKYRTQKIAKNSPSAHHRTTLSGCIFATKAHIDSWKKLVRPTSGWDVSLVWCTPANFNGFRVLAALLHSTLVGVAKFCDVEQRAPPIFGRAAITLGIGPHSSFWILWQWCLLIYRYCNSYDSWYCNFSVHEKR